MDAKVTVCLLGLFSAGKIEDSKREVIRLKDGGNCIDLNTQILRYLMWQSYNDALMDLMELLEDDNPSKVAELFDKRVEGIDGLVSKGNMSAKASAFRDELDAYGVSDDRA